MVEGRRPNYRPLYVVVAIALLAAVLLSPASAFTRQGVTFIDTELKSKDTSTRQFVETKYPIGDPEGLANFPTHLGKWRMTHEYEWDFLAELLDTDLLMSRDYRAPGVYIPVSLLILQSTNVSSFHPAPICYKAQGYTILDEQTSTVQVPVENATWARTEGWLSEDEGRVFQGSIAAKRLVVERTTKEGNLQRELNLYFYIKEEKQQITDRVAWIRASMFVPATGDYSKHEQILADFMGAVVPELFNYKEQPDDGTLLEALAAPLFAKASGGEVGTAGNE